MEKEPLIRNYSEKLPTILLFGPPGSGKGTLGKFLANAGAQYHLAAGDIFRSLPLDSPAGKLYRTCASKGELIPDESTIEIWNHYVQGLMATNSYYPECQDLLLDGLPRTRVQAELLQEHIYVRHIIVLEVSNTQELIKRVVRRAELETNFKEVSPEVLEKRFHNYQNAISSILEFYPSHLISKVNGAQRPLEVLRDVLVRLSHVLSRGGPPNFH